ncbi:MAG: GGDEF domain-containing phosphodiesterase [Sulfurimonas sp.]|nr:GGDEF domain-containing phosphodiesterase [Sulfurimonas sp.]
MLEDLKTKKISKIAILNIDKFQSFNDIYGEELGNIAISMSANFLITKTREEELKLYHLSGDEFCLVCTKKDNTETEKFIQTIQSILKDFSAEEFNYEKQTFQLVMSAGVSFSGKEKMLAYADMALNDAKKRNVPLSIFNEDKQLEKTHKNDLECHKKLVSALKRDSLLSYFQPIIPIQDKTLSVKYESLVRLQDEDGKIIPPFNFLDVAKTNRIYYKVSQVVIKNTFSVVQKYKIPCSINISLQDIENELTMKYFFSLLEEFAYSSLLTVELLETENFKNYNLVYNFCIKVRSYGVKIALDDFGSGYANFSHILNLPIDFIKIDASLISDIDRNHNSQIMVETIVALAKKLHVATIAEFVSSAEILEVVKKLGVDYAQGFHLGRPEPIEKHLKREED